RSAIACGRGSLVHQIPPWPGVRGAAASSCWNEGRRAREAARARYRIPGQDLTRLARLQVRDVGPAPARETSRTEAAVRHPRARDPAIATTPALRLKVTGCPPAASSA